MTSRSDKLSRILPLSALIFSGEMIFSLPFHIARFFRPTVLDVFGLSNANLGDIFAFYGVLAMLAYLPGGTLADHFSARKLLALSLLATAAGGCFMLVVPDRAGMFILFAFWGLTSILLFWAALIRATREWGGQLEQGRAFGLLDGGRGLLAALFASGAVWIFGLLLGGSTGTPDAQDQRRALQAVILYYTVITASAALLAWIFIPEMDAGHKSTYRNPLKDIRHVIKRGSMWLQAVIVVCAYCGYKGLDNYGLYAVEVLDMNAVEAARFTSLAAYLRPVAAISIGWLADRLMASRMVVAMFVILAASYALLYSLSPVKMAVYIIYANLLITFFAVYALRGIYFALLEEAKINYRYTGTAVGFISLIGFTPDVFFASLSGRLLDAAPGLSGHQNFFALLIVFAFIGLFCSLMLTPAIATRIFNRVSR